MANLTNQFRKYFLPYQSQNLPIVILLGSCRHDQLIARPISLLSTHQTQIFGLISRITEMIDEDTRMQTERFSSENNRSITSFKYLAHILLNRLQTNRCNLTLQIMLIITNTQRRLELSIITQAPFTRLLPQWSDIFGTMINLVIEMIDLGMSDLRIFISLGSLLITLLQKSDLVF